MSDLYAILFTVGLGALVLERLARRAGGRAVFPMRAAAALVSALLLSQLTLRGFQAGRVFEMLGYQPSVPMLVWVWSAVAEQFTARPWLRLEERRSLAAFGIVAGLVLFPPALGMGSWDAYALGWSGLALPAGLLLTAALLAGRGNRFGLVLGAAAMACWLGIAGSSNLWDYVVDPVYTLAASGWWARQLIAGRRRGSSLGAEA